MTPLDSDNGHHCCLSYLGPEHLRQALSAHCPSCCIMDFDVVSVSASDSFFDELLVVTDIVISQGLLRSSS